jgi:ABC-type transporter MlaC component
MKAILVASIVSAYFFTAQDPQIMLHTQYKAYITVQAFNPKAVAKYRDRILNKKKRVPKSAQKFMNTNIDWEMYAETIFRPNWENLSKKQKKHFKKLLQRDVIERYGHLYSPDLKFSAKFRGETQYKILRGHKFARVSTTLKSTSSDAEVDIDFIFHRGAKRWALCDVHIDGVSKSKAYRQSVRKIYKNHGYSGVVKIFEKRLAQK